MGIPLYVICCFFFVALNIFSLSLIFVNLINMCLIPPWVCPVWDSLCFLDMGDCFLSYVREIFSYYLIKYFLGLFLSHLSIWDSYNAYIGPLRWCLMVPEARLILLIFVFWSFSFSVWKILIDLKFSDSSSSSNLLLSPFSDFLFVCFSYYIFQL